MYSPTFVNVNSGECSIDSPPESSPNFQSHLLVFSDLFMNVTLRGIPPLWVEAVNAASGGSTTLMVFSTEYVHPDIVSITNLIVFSPIELNAKLKDCSSLITDPSNSQVRATTRSSPSVRSSKDVSFPTQFPVNSKSGTSGSGTDTTVS